MLKHINETLKKITIIVALAALIVTIGWPDLTTVKLLLDMTYNGLQLISFVLALLTKSDR